MSTTALIIAGPAGSGKSHWIQAYAKEKRKQLLSCPCRKDRTLREGRQKLHIWGRRREPTILWLEGADDLTPEAQAFLRRILETHSADVQFVLECRDPGKLQEPIRSRCTIQRLVMPTRAVLMEYITRAYTNIDVDSIFTYLAPDEYSYRRIQQALFLQMQYPLIWKTVIAQRSAERAAAKDARAELVPSYQSSAFHPEIFLEPLLDKNPALLGEYGECLELSGSLWAFLGYAL